MTILLGLSIAAAVVVLLAIGGLVFYAKQNARVHAHFERRRIRRKIRRAKRIKIHWTWYLLYGLPFSAAVVILIVGWPRG